MNNSHQPENLHDVAEAIKDLFEIKDLRLISSGLNFSNGDEHDLEVELPGGMQVFIKIRESQDDEYLVAKHYLEEDEDPDGRSRTMHLTDTGAEALRRELEEADHFKQVMDAQDATDALTGDDRVIKDAMAYIRAQRERQGLDPDEDVGIGFAPGTQ